MIRWVNPLKRITDDIVIQSFQPSPEENPVDMVPQIVPCKSVKGRGMIVLKQIPETGIRKKTIGLGIRRRIEISGNDRWNIVGKVFQEIYNQPGAFFLDRWLKVKMGVHMNQGAALVFKQADGALTGPFTLGKLAFHMGGIT